MNLVKYNNHTRNVTPFSLLTPLWNDFIDDVNFWNFENYRKKEEWTDDSVVYSMALPGYKKENIKIKIEANYLTVTAQNNGENFYEGFPLSGVIDINKITAKLEDGVLKIVCQLLDSAKPRTIKIE